MRKKLNGELSSGKRLRGKTPQEKPVSPNDLQPDQDHLAQDPLTAMGLGGEPYLANDYDQDPPSCGFYLQP